MCIVYVCFVAIRSIRSVLQISPRRNMDAISGVDVSNPARLRVFLSVGSTMVKQLPVIPMTISFVCVPMSCRYLTSAD